MKHAVLVRAAVLMILGTAAVLAVAQQPQPPRDARLGPQPAPAGTATITGAVSMAGGQPARNVRVNLSGAELRGGRSTTTDDQGRFSFAGLPAGRYTVSASKPGHLSVTFGQRRPGGQGTPIQLSDGQKFQAQLQIPRASVITGVVLDENGEATPGTNVRAMRFVVQNGVRTLQSSGSGSTDDRGIYRIYGLQPGEYAVCATPRNSSIPDFGGMQAELQALRQQTTEQAATSEVARSIQERMAAVQASIAETAEAPISGYAPVCYPGTTTITEASPVPLSIAEERPGIDFQLRRVPLSKIEGTVINATGAPVQGLLVTLQDAAPGGMSLGPNTGRPVDAEGRFTIPAVAPGHYKLTARGRMGGPQRGDSPTNPLEVTPARGRGRSQAVRPDPITLWAAADVVIDGRDVPNVMLSLQNGMTVSGQLQFEGAASPPSDLTRIRVTVTAAEPRQGFVPTAGGVDAGGRFVVPGVPPGRYRLTATGAAGWFVESANVGGVDVLDFPFEVKPNQHVSGVTITFTDRQTELAGVIVDNRKQPAVDYTLLIFPADQKYWTGSSRRIQTTRPGTDGRYRIRNLPPGDYRIATLLDIEPGASQNAGFLQQLEPSTMKISLVAGEQKTQDIQLSIAGR